MAASDEVRNLHLDRFHVVGRRRSNDREVLTLSGKSTADFGVEFRVETTGEPDFCILRWEARNAKQKNELLTLYEVTEMADFRGIRYPAKGNYRQVGIGESNDVRYTFEVISVESLPDDIREHWLPPWPPFTIVTDQTKGGSSAAPDESSKRAEDD